MTIRFYNTGRRALVAASVPAGIGQTATDTDRL